jgi:hypothetical protein
MHVFVLGADEGAGKSKKQQLHWRFDLVPAL